MKEENALKRGKRRKNMNDRSPNSDSDSRTVVRERRARDHFDSELFKSEILTCFH